MPLTLFRLLFQILSDPSPPKHTHITHAHTHCTFLYQYYSECHNTPIGGLSISVDPDGATSIAVSWMVISSITPSGYVISYSNIDNTQCFTISNTTSIAGSLSSYTIEGLQEATQYSITVSIVDLNDHDTAVAATMAAGMKNNDSKLKCVSNESH